MTGPVQGLQTMLNGDLVRAQALSMPLKTLNDTTWSILH
jgi:hypothetical protein